MTFLICLMYALLAIINQPIQPPTDFYDQMLSGHAVYMPGTFIGMEWPCGHGYDENCYAGHGYSARGPWVTGP